MAPVDDPLVVLDLGSHHGFYAVTALAMYPRATLIAVEPSDEGVARVRRNLELNGVSHRVRLVEAGLAAEAGTGTLLHTDEGSWGNSLFQEEGVQVLGREQVTLLTLAEILDGERPDVIKCNAEGAEFALIAQLVRQRHPAGADDRDGASRVRRSRRLATPDRRARLSSRTVRLYAPSGSASLARRPNSS